MPHPTASDPPLAVVGGRLATELVDVTSDLRALDSSGFWAVVLPFEGDPICARFAQVRPARLWPGPSWRGPAPSAWSIQSSIAAGDVYQVNLTRRLSAPLPAEADVAALGAALAEGNPAPYSAVVRIPTMGCQVASASPERFLWRHGDLVSSAPIKGTAADPSGLTAKDRAENIMIVDLVRNDLGRVCEFGSIDVPALLALEHHPGLVHLVSTVTGRLRPTLGWAELLAVRPAPGVWHLVSTVRGQLRDGLGWADAIGATFPPGSVTGAPKIAALEQIAALEPVPRGVYCGAVGWVDADRRQGDLNVAIRTFWVDDGMLHLGTGGAITWDSEPDDEWAETELKARQLLRVASGSWDA